MLGRARASILAGHVLVSPLAALAPLSLAGAPMGLPIHWETPPACVDAAAVPARVGALVGEGSTVAGTLRLGAERRGEGWTVSLVLEPREGAEGSLRRTLEGRDCATLTDAVALVVAVHLDAVATAGVITAGPSALPPEVPQASRVVPPVERSAAQASSFVRPQPASDATTGSAAKPRPGPRALASLAVAGELGVLPRGAGALELAGGVGWSHARLELGALASLGPNAVSERVAGVGGRFRLLTGLVRGCGVPARGRVALPLCGGLELGDLRASGTGLRRPATVDALWVAAVASARPQWSPRRRSAAGPGDRRRARLALGALLDLVVPLRRHRFATAEAGLVHAVDPVAVRLGLRVELWLP